MTSWCGSGSGSISQRHGSADYYWPSRCQQKTNLNKSFSAYYSLKVPKEPDPDPCLWLMDPDSDPGGPKTCGSGGSGSGFGSGFATLLFYTLTLNGDFNRDCFSKLYWAESGTVLMVSHYKTMYCYAVCEQSLKISLNMVKWPINLFLSSYFFNRLSIV
jgi:hypothetical protein